MEWKGIQVSDSQRIYLSLFLSFLVITQRQQGKESHLFFDQTKPSFSLKMFSFCLFFSSEQDCIDHVFWLKLVDETSQVYRSYVLTRVSSLSHSVLKSLSLSFIIWSFHDTKKSHPSSIKARISGQRFLDRLSWLPCHRPHLTCIWFSCSVYLVSWSESSILSSILVTSLDLSCSISQGIALTMILQW